MKVTEVPSTAELADKCRVTAVAFTDQREQVIQNHDPQWNQKYKTNYCDCLLSTSKLQNSIMQSQNYLP